MGNQQEPREHIDPDIPVSRLFVQWRALAKSDCKARMFEIFAPFGNVKNVKLPIDHDGTHHTFGFVTFKAVSSAVKARETLHGRIFDNERMHVRFSQDTYGVNSPEDHPSDGSPAHPKATKRPALSKGDSLQADPRKRQRAESPKIATAGSQNYLDTKPQITKRQRIERSEASKKQHSEELNSTRAIPTKQPLLWSSDPAKRTCYDFMNLPAAELLRGMETLGPQMTRGIQELRDHTKQELADRSPAQQVSRVKATIFSWLHMHVTDAANNKFFMLEKSNLTPKLDDSPKDRQRRTFFFAAILRVRSILEHWFVLKAFFPALFPSWTDALRTAYIALKGLMDDLDPCFETSFNSSLDVDRLRRFLREDFPVVEKEIRRLRPAELFQHYPNIGGSSYH